MPRIMYVASGIIRDKDTWVYTAYGPSANLQDAALHFYRNALGWLQAYRHNKPPYPAALDLAKSKSFEIETKIPAVRTSCMEHEGLVLENTVINITFPRLDQLSVYRVGVHREAGRVIDITAQVEQSLKARGLTVGNGTTFSLAPQAPDLLVVPVDIDAGDASSLGLMIMKRLNATTLSPVTCTVDARWAKGRSTIESKLEGDDIQHHDFVSDHVRNTVRASLDSDDYITTTLNYFAPQDRHAYTHVRLHPSWYDLLSPSMSDAAISQASSASAPSVNTTSHPSDGTLLERLLKRAAYPVVGQHSDYELGFLLAGVEVATSMFFAAGLSRAGWPSHTASWRLFPSWRYGLWEVMTETLARSMVRRGDPAETFPAPSGSGSSDGGDAAAAATMTRVVMRARFNGNAMAATNWFDYVSVAILLAHVVVAIAHTAWSLWVGEASEAWDSVAEMVVLAQRSEPAGEEVLGSTCAGLRSMKTMGRVATVEAADSGTGMGMETEELQLRFREAWEERDKRLLPEVGRAYGVV